MDRSTGHDLRKLFEILSSPEVLTRLKLCVNDRLILKGYWVDKMSRKKLAQKLNVNPSYISNRYSMIVKKIQNSLSYLIKENTQLRKENEKLEELELIKQQYLSFHKERTGTYPKLPTTDDSIENVKMSTRLYRYLKDRHISHLLNLRNYTKRDLLKGFNFGEGTLTELEGIMERFDIHFKELL